MANVVANLAFCGLLWPRPAGALVRALATSKLASRRRHRDNVPMPTVLVTAGPTREHLDEVRFLSNGSTGAMGYAIAAAARAAGCEVVLVSGPTHLAAPAGVEVVRVVGALEMLTAGEAAFDRCDVLLAVAAVADHRPKHRVSGKPSKTAAYTLELVANPDIVATLAARKGRRVVGGFALDAADEPMAVQRQRALAKLQRKQLDFIALNDATALGAATSAVTVLEPGGTAHELPAQDKAVTARWLVEFALAKWRGGGR